MKRFWSMSIIVLMIVIMATGCSSDDDKASGGKKKEKASESGEINVNLYSGKERPENILDQAHDYYEPLEDLDYGTVNYIDETIFIYGGKAYDEYSHAFDLKTGERIWDNDIRVNVFGYRDAPVHDGLLYYRDGDDRGKITIQNNPKENESTDIDEEEYKIHTSQYIFDDNSYIIEGDDTRKILAYDLDTLEQKWELELSDFNASQGKVFETDDYTIVDTYESHVYFIDKETGDVLHEEDTYYDEVVQVDDTLYLIYINGITGDFFTLYAMDTTTWEEEEVLSEAGEDSNDFTTDYLELVHVDDRIVFMYEYGIYIIDIDQNNVQNYFYYDDPETDGPLSGFTTMSGFIHQGDLYTLSDHKSHKTFNIIDIATGDIKQEYGFGDVGEDGDYSSIKLNRRGEGNKVIEKITEDSFVIVTRDTGIYEFKFADINK